MSLICFGKIYRLQTLVVKFVMYLWAGVFHNVFNKHPWACGRFKHDSLKSKSNKKKKEKRKMQPGPSAHYPVSKLVLDIWWLGTI